MIRIVAIITGLSTGGAEAMLLKMLKRIDRNRYAMHVISLTDKGEIGPRIESLNIPVEALGMRPGVLSVFGFVRLLSRLRVLRPDVVHTWMYHSDLLGGLAARLVGIRNIGWALHNSNLDRDKSKVATRAVMRTCAVASNRIPLRILSCSERARSIHVAAGYCASKMVVVPNGFDLDQFHPDSESRVSVRQELGLAPDTLLVGLIARSDPQKNHMGFVDAARQVQERIQDVHFLLAGSGIDATHPTLMQYIDGVGLRDAFHLMGQRADIPRLMASLDVLVSSSHSEAFPNVLGEAMACGVPCVVTNAGDSADMVGDTGRVVSVGDMASLAREVIRVLDMPPAQRRALGLKARERVRDKYEIGRVVREYEAFYDSLSQTGETCAG